VIDHLGNDSFSFGHEGADQGKLAGNDLARREKIRHLGAIIGRASPQTRLWLIPRIVEERIDDHED